MNYEEPTSPTATKSNIGQAARFDLTAIGQPGAGNVEAALGRNRAFAGAGRASAGPDPGVDHDRDRGLPEGVRRAESRGVEFETDVLEYPWGYVALFQDPDGNWLQIREGH